MSGIDGGAHALDVAMMLRLAILGDSIAYGIGAQRTADTLAPRLTAELTAAGWQTRSQVFALPGARSSDLARQVAAASAWQPDLALIVIGANDLTRLVPPEQAAGQLRDAVRSLRALGTEVVVAPAPDLSVVPHVPPRCAH
jgi:lysophospholipase L1-like esterase